MDGMDTAWNGSLEQMHGTEVWNRCTEQSWNGNTLSGTTAWNRSLEQMHGTAAWNESLEKDAWNRAGMEILCLEQLHGTEVWNGNTLSGTAAWNGSLEQMHGTDLKRKYFVWNNCMERKS